MKNYLETTRAVTKAVFMLMSILLNKFLKGKNRRIITWWNSGSILRLPYIKRGFTIACHTTKET